MACPDLNTHPSWGACTSASALAADLKSQSGFAARAAPLTETKAVHTMGRIGHIDYGGLHLLVSQLSMDSVAFA